MTLEKKTNITKKCLSNNLAIHRKRKNYTVHFLAKKANVKEELIKKIEEAECLPTLKVIIKISVALEVSVDTLLNIDSDK